MLLLISAINVKIVINFLLDISHGKRWIRIGNLTRQDKPKDYCINILLFKYYTYLYST